MKGIVINKGSSEIVINLDKLKYTSTSSVNFGKVMLHGLSSEDITSIENALESAEKHSAAIEVGDRAINLDSITHLDDDTIYYSDGPHISGVATSDMEVIEAALEAYSPSPTPPVPSNLKFDPLHWTDVTSEWTLPAGLSDFSTLLNLGTSAWTDNQGNYYYGRSLSYPVYKIDFENKSIIEMTGWDGRTGSQFWRIGDTVLYGVSYVWNPDNTVSYVTWMGEPPASTAYIWTDGEHIYWTDPSRNSGVLTNFGYVAGIGYTGTWESVTFTYTPSSFDPKYVWTDGERVYYSKNANQYVLDKANRDWQISVIDFQGYTLSDPTLQLFTDGTDIYMNSRGSAGSDNKLLKYDRAMWTFEVVSYPFEYKGPANMLSKFMICPSCRYKGLPSALGNINPNTDDIYNRVSSTKVVAMDKIEVE